MLLKIKILLLFITIYELGFSAIPDKYDLYYVRTNTDKTFKEISELNNFQFSKYETGKTFFKTNETYWVKIVNNDSVELSNVLLLLNTPISKIECFAYDRNNILRHNQAGIDIPYSNQLIKTGDKNKIYLNFRINRNIIFLKLTNDLFFKYNIDKLEIKPVNEWILKKEKQHLFQGFFIGIIVILIFINVLFKISAIKHINYYYIAYLLSNLVLFLFLNEYSVEFIFFNQPRIDLCLMSSMHFASLFFIQFARSFFQTKKLHVRLDKIVENYIRLSLIAIFCLLITSYFDFAIYSYLAIIIEVFNQLIGIMLVIFAFRKTDIIGKLIIFGSLFSTIDVLYILYSNHIVELTTQNLNFYQTGYIVEILFIIIAIRVRYRQAEKEQQEVLIKNAVLNSENKIKDQENLLLRKEKDIAELNTKLLESMINKKDKEIAMNIMQLTQKDQLIDNLHEKVKKILPETTGINKQDLSEILQNLNNHQKDTFWKEFDIYFEQMHNGFFSKLSAKYPSLTQSDKRLCAFLKVGMSSKEIATITMKNFKSIEVFRSRLRKKLELETNENLTDFLNKIAYE